jgi:hypothetical protein
MVPPLVYLASDERNSKRWPRRGVWILELGTRAAAGVRREDVLTVGYVHRRAAAASCGLGYVTWAHRGNFTPLGYESDSLYVLLLKTFYSRWLN